MHRARRVSFTALVLLFYRALRVILRHSLRSSTKPAESLYRARCVLVSRLLVEESIARFSAGKKPETQDGSLAEQRVAGLGAGGAKKTRVRTLD